MNSNVVVKRVPFIQYMGDTERGVAGFLNRETGEFDVERTIENARDIDDFVTEHDLSFVSIRRAS